jgi:hypothetical protein
MAINPVAIIPDPAISAVAMALHAIRFIALTFSLYL